MVGSGGRENALAWAFSNCKDIEKIWVAPGNGGTHTHPGCINLDIKEHETKKLIDECLLKKVDLIVIGPEAPLAAGLADEMRKAGLPVFGPGADGALLEASKTWAKELMIEAGIPTAQYWSVNTQEKALKVLNEWQRPLVVKADGLAGGKGVTVTKTTEETAIAIKEIFKNTSKDSTTKLVLEEELVGPEVSVFALCDGEKMTLLPSAQDHKRLKEGDVGPNTGGMGAYSPAPLLNKKGLNDVKKIVLEPTLKALKNRGIDYRGVIYAGLMLTTSGIKVIEFNCRFGDPECQTIMPLLGPELPIILQACALGCLEKAPKLSISDLCSACVVAAASGYPTAPRSGDLLNINFKSEKTIQIFHAGTKRSEENKIYSSGGRVLSIVAQAKHFDEAFSKVYKGMDDIYFDGITYRNDIGHQVRNF